MGNDFTTSLRPAIVLTILFALLLGLGYPLAMTGIGQALFADRANGSLVRDAQGRVIGSSVIGQAFTSDRYFQTRPSAAGKGYDGLASSGSNYGPTSQALVDRVKADVARRHGEGVGTIPADLVTASASGLDPDLSPDAAYVQIARIARIRGLSEATLRALVDRQVAHPLAGFVGEDRVNVLMLNLALDRIAVH
ncbi:potassium-transporting ATPase subunit KdpC [Sphingomonas nostoxanthinifaciens]|uniref:potassium-transporting ATPase subunit KdpC n=1 Tax=Sphingomonas nostoxanthinifaciens TaxID=2872652 RepID=UPI001CC1F4D9|nr:potassium-transporting ATPase subunit KdpC [Sphingomonas nostoxanthinifaciens]UAK25827.1 potassium-transporting ATPase subunit KdpC [Sphingomonas nostoxanthinifaciens]